MRRSVLGRDIKMKRLCGDPHRREKGINNNEKNRRGKVWGQGAQHCGEKSRGSPATLATAEVGG